MANDFTRGMAMMRKQHPQTQKDGFGLVRQVAAEHVHDLIEAYRNESGHGLRCWLLELLGEARSPEALPIFSEALASRDGSIRFWGHRGLESLNTQEARAVLWKASQRPE